jgi:hypothetical protein
MERKEVPEVTHIKQLTETFYALGIEYEVCPMPNGGSRGAPPGVTQEVRIYGNGYPEFYHAFEFDEAGKLLNHGSWE